jgi:lactate dehydrogenase-like 2-hydroxyacid dehydrogenase
MPSVVVVTESEYRKAEAVFASAPALSCVVAPAEEDALAAAIAREGARHAVVSHRPYRGPLYEALPRGGVLARFGVGYENVDLARATAAGLLCTNTPGVLDQSVAELTMTLVVSAARHVPDVASAMRARTWSPVAGIELHGKTLTIVGCGRIGRAVARIAARGFGMRVIGCTRPPTAGEPVGDTRRADPDFEFVTSDFAEAVAGAHFVSVHVPGRPENARFIDAARLAHLERDAWLINTARGAVLDESALYDALAGGRLGGAALDVFDREPYEPIDPSRDLRMLPNVVLTPHVGSNTTEANRRMAERALANIVLAEAGDIDAMDLLNPQVLDERRAR